MRTEVSLPIDYDEVAEFCALLKGVDGRTMPRHLREAAERLKTDAVVVYADGRGITAALKPEARALVAMIRAQQEVGPPAPGFLRPPG